MKSSHSPLPTYFHLTHKPSGFSLTRLWKDHEKGPPAAYPESSLGGIRIMHHFGSRPLELNLCISSRQLYTEMMDRQILKTIRRNIFAAHLIKSINQAGCIFQTKEKCSGRPANTILVVKITQKIIGS